MSATVILDFGSTKLFKRMQDIHIIIAGNIIFVQESKKHFRNNLLAACQKHIVCLCQRQSETIPQNIFVKKSRSLLKHIIHG